jgi:uncharacterized membrane protein YidH (DUF202 family)
MAPPDPLDGDPGLARERTRLAWMRTALAFAAVGAVILHREVLPGLAILALAPVVWALGRLPAHRLAAPQQARRLLAVTVTVVLISIVAASVALLGPAPDSLEQILRLPR